MGVITLPDVGLDGVRLINVSYALKPGFTGEPVQVSSMLLAVVDNTAGPTGDGQIRAEVTPSGPYEFVPFHTLFPNTDSIEKNWLFRISFYPDTNNDLTSQFSQRLFISTEAEVIAFDLPLGTKHFLEVLVARRAGNKEVSAPITVGIPYNLADGQFAVKAY